MFQKRFFGETPHINNFGATKDHRKLDLKQARNAGVSRWQPNSECSFTFLEKSFSVFIHGPIPKFVDIERTQKYIL